MQYKCKKLFPNFNHQLGQNTLIHWNHYVPKVTPTLFSLQFLIFPRWTPSTPSPPSTTMALSCGRGRCTDGSPIYGFVDVFYCGDELERGRGEGGGGAKQARACMDKKEAKKRGQFYADRRSPQSDRWESWWSQWYDNHDHHIDYILLIFGDLPTLQMITFCCETGNRKQGWAWT